MNEQQIREIIRDELRNFFGLDRFYFQKNLQIFDGKNIQIGRTVGTKIGTEATQKIGFYGVTPIVQQARATDLPSVVDILKNIGITN